MTLLIALAWLEMWQGAIAAEYVLELPHLIGIHGTAPYTALDVSVQLPARYSKIDAASLRLTGQHFPGATTSVIGGSGGPISAILQLENAPPNSPYHYPYPYFYRGLPLDLYEFDLEIPIEAPYEPTSDFLSWLDGSAEFTFSVGPPPILAIYAFSVYPLVTIDRAELVIVGEPLQAPEPTTGFLISFVGILCGVTRRRVPLALPVS
jgi:hypothetical protein